MLKYVKNALILNKMLMVLNFFVYLHHETATELNLLKLAIMLNKQKLQISVLKADKKMANKIAFEFTSKNYPRKDSENGFAVYMPMLNNEGVKKLCPILKFTYSPPKIEWDERVITLF